MYSLSMVEIFLKLTEQLNSSVFFLLVIFIVLIYLVYKLGGWAKTFQHQEKRLDNVESLSERVIKIETKVDLIYQHVNPHSTVKSYSPLGLTSSGKEIAAKIDADTLLNKYLSVLSKEVDLANPKNAYDIQEKSVQVAKEKLLTLLSSDELTLIKQEAFSKGILVEDVMLIFSVMLRDKILQAKQIPLSDVDKHKK